MRIKRPVTVKLIVTERTREQLLHQCEQSIRQTELELEQLAFERRKLLHRAEKIGREAFEQAEARLEREVSGRKEQLEQLSLKREYIMKLEEGQEIVHGQVESEVEINVGDRWDDIVNRPEIVLKDGIVHEIREGNTRGRA